MKSKILKAIGGYNINVKIVDPNEIPINGISMIKYAKEGDLCYVDGPAYHLTNNKKSVFLICPLDFKESNKEISYIKTKDPKLLFYKLSHLFGKISINSNPFSANKYPGAIIDTSVEIGNNVTILPGAVIYPNVKIGDNTIIESGAVIGCTGLLWTWDGDNKVMLYTNGNVEIGKGCHISANVSIVRGACGETTKVGDGVMIAPGTAIGHGCDIHKNVHIANNVTLAGSVTVGENCFLGSACVIQPAIHLLENSVLGSGSVLTKTYEKSGVFAGIPARNLNKDLNKIKGVPLRKI